MDCMMACLAECTELWPDAALEPRGDDSKDDGDGECNPHRDPWKERRPVAWQAEQVTDGGHENKPPCPALPAPSSKDPSGQRERCGSATGQDTSERFDVSSTPTARQQKQQQPSPGSAGSKSSQEVPDYCGQQEPSPAFAAAAERAEAAALRAARAMAHAEEAAHVAREAESSADRAVKAATSAAHRITPRQAQAAASSPQGLQLQLEEPQQHQQHQQQLQLEQQQLQLEKQKQQLEEQKKHLQHQQRLLEQEELEQQQLYLTEGEDEEDDEEDEEEDEEEEIRGRLDSAAGLSTSDFQQQQQQQTQSQLHRFDVTPIKQGGGSSTRLRAVEVEHASAWTTATTRSGSLTSKATPLTTPLTSASASGAAGGGGGGGGFSSSSMSAPPPGSPLDFHHDAMSTTDHHYLREHRDNSTNNHHHHHHHHHPHQHQHHHDHYRSERGERVRSTALTSTCTNRGSVGGIDSDGVSDLSDSDLSAIMTASLMGQITPKDDCSLSGDATPRGRGGGGGGSSSGGWATYSVEEVLRGSGAGGSASDAWVAAAAAATPSQVGSIGSGSVGRTRDGGSASVAWPGPMYRRAASMGTEWLKLDQPEDTSTSKHKSLPRRYARLANPDSEPERAREDSGVGGLAGGGGGSSGSSRFGRGWNVDPGGSLERKGVPPTPSKALVTTHLRHLRLSPDGAVMMVQPSDGQAEYEFVLADLIEVRENIPQETVTLIGRQVKIRIAFEGQTVALKQFSAMLAPAWKPRTSTVDSVEPAATEWDSRRGNEVEQTTEADEEEGPISHPERLVRSSEPIQTSRSAPSSRTTMTRASAMWQAADVRSGTTSIGWESLMISPVVSIQSGGGWEPVGAISKKLSLPALFDSFSGSQFDSPAPSAVGVQAMSATASDYYEAGGRSPISMLVSSQQHHHQQQQQQQQEMKSSRRSSRAAPLARRRHREPEDALREGMTLTLPSLMDAGEPPEVAMPSFNGIAKTQQLRSATDHALDEPYISSSRSWRANDEMDRRGESSGELRSAA